MYVKLLIRSCFFQLKACSYKVSSSLTRNFFSASLNICSFFRGFLKITVISKFLIKALPSAGFLNVRDRSSNHSHSRDVVQISKSIKHSFTRKLAQAWLLLSFRCFSDLTPSIIVWTTISFSILTVFICEGKNHLLTNDASGDRVTSFIPTFFIPARSAIIYMLLMTFVLYMLYASKFGYKYLTA
ncbi:hypothetical protein CFPG_697 [Candidatus Azobacteroides pseudotrichonymphae genomovar. CFP2]|uniref:Uncharacterized protein n=1 Tax=Azobacteroides pseudotrichonymphae genomovar. CFP2 TaxID=511995 RepID=B6YRY8_AZOPC|nr:hypothetical protein CFPG_697 [Candidatus Azobacteroides pseudotrichonymphae genomovar. CFP2]